ncbi:MAG: rhomboid family intramembrane serine protease [Actinomycetota bacterium]|nr:rhomboid family intramembrane serine protease [Actinomycetota bacterium]
MVIPVHDENPTRRRAVVTYLLIAVNVLVFLISPVATHVVGSSALKQECDTLAFFDHWAAKPKELVENKPLPSGATGQVGETRGGAGCVVTSPPPYNKHVLLSVLTAMFLHGGWLHLLGNMLFLFVFGNNVEDRMGRLRYLLFYLGCGYAATYGFALFDSSSDQPLVGASGAIAGVLGAYLVLYPRARVLSLLSFFFFLPVRLPAWLVLGGWFLLQYVYARGAGVAAGPQVAYRAHVVGFVVGAAVVLAMGLRSRPPDRRRVV